MVPMPSNFLNYQRYHEYPTTQPFEAHFMENLVGKAKLAILDENIEATIAALSVENPEYNWVLDSGALRHSSSDPNLFSTLDENNNHVMVTMASSQDHVIVGKGSIQLPMQNGEIKTIKDVH